MSDSDEVEFNFANEYLCFEELDECEEEKSSEDEAPNSDTTSIGRTESDDSLSKTYGNITVHVIKANIIHQQVDVIVNSTTKSLDLTKGAASKTILKKGGKSIQSECTNKYANGIQTGDIAITKAGRLPCQQIYHLFLPRWNENDRNSEIQDVMIKCLQTASSSGHTSIAFPALGAGNLGYDKEFVAKAMFNTVEKFSKANSSTSLTTVNFVLFPTDYGTIEAFTEFCQRTSLGQRLFGTFQRFLSHVTGYLSNSPASSSSSSPDMRRSPPSVRELRAHLGEALLPALLPANIVKIGNISVSILTGTLGEQNSDVIMTSCTRGLDMNRGTLSKTLSDAAGPSLQMECNQKYPRGVQHGEIATLGPGNLNSKKVYCGALPRYDRPEGTEPLEVLGQLITTCLQQVSKDRMKSISFPLLGCGYLKYPDHLAAKTMFKSINQFWISDNGTTLRTVNIVVFGESETSKAHKQAYMNELKTWKKKPATLSKPKPTPAPRVRTAVPATPPRNTPEFCRHMYTRHIRPPDDWTVYTTNKTIKQWKLEKGKQKYACVDVTRDEFAKVQRLVLNTWEGAKKGHGRDAKGLDSLKYNSLKVTRVQRIENLNLYEEYGNKKQALFDKAYQGKMFTKLSDIKGLSEGPSRVDKYLDKTWKDGLHSEVNEGYFFHGTKEEKIEGVKKMGLDPRMAGGEAVLGKAIYMAESSTKADQYTDSRDAQRTSRNLQMFLVRACLGNICLMDAVRKMNRPPCCVPRCSDNSCNHEIRYDSVIVEGAFLFREFVLYDLHQVYPEYLITYDRV